MGSLSSSFTITFLSGTDSLYPEQQVVKFTDDSSSAESAGSLLQVYNTSTKAVTPDWTESTNQPCIKLGLTKSSDGSNIALTDGCSFKYQGEEISFGSSTTSLNGLTWYTSTDGMFMKAYSADGTYIYLRICENIASANITTNQQIEYTLGYSETGFGTGEVSGTADILIREGSSSSVYCNILTDNSELSNSVPSTVLSVQYIYGDTEYTSLASLQAALPSVNGIMWYKDGESLGISDETLTVYREEDDDSGAYTGNYVYGSNVFSVMVYDASGNVLASDSQRITDVADKYQIKLTDTSTVRESKDATIAGILYEGGSVYTGSVSYTTTVYNANNELTGEADSSCIGTSGFSRTITAAECKYTNADGESEYGDCTLVVSVTF